MPSISFRSSLTAIFLFTFCLAVCSGLSAQENDTLLFSSLATDVSNGKPAKSPDGKKVVNAKENDNTDDFPLDISITTGTGKLTARINFGLNAQVLWSPDSTAFAITGSSQGANGLYETEVFYIRDAQLVRIPLTKVVQQEFGHPVKCGWPEAPNIGAVTWLTKKGRLVLAAQIISHSNCDSFGTFKAYVVDTLTPRILRGYDQIEAKKKFASALGPLLRDADDSCIRNPKSCYVSTNHPELKSKTEK